MIARAGAARIHRAEPLGVRTLVVGRRLLGAVDERLKRHALKAQHSDEQQGEALCPPRTSVYGGKMHHSKAM